MTKPILYALDLYSAVLRIHLKTELTKKSVETYHAQDCPCSTDQERPAYITGLLKTEGVMSVKLERYNIDIFKGEIFGWKEMIEDILEHMLIGIDPTGELLQERPCREYYKNNFNVLEYREKKLPDIPNPFRIIPKLPSAKNKPGENPDKPKK